MREQIANHTIQRASRQYAPPPEEEVEDDDGYTARMPRSALRYGVGRPYTIQQGNRRIVLHPEPPPKKSKHYLVYIGIGMIAMLALWVSFQMLGSWLSEHQLDATYGFLEPTRSMRW